jgi:hypothetical protein
LKAFRRRLIAERDDITLEEMRVRQREERTLKVRFVTLWSSLDTPGLTYRERQPTPRSRTART